MADIIVTARQKSLWQAKGKTRFDKEMPRIGQAVRILPELRLPKSILAVPASAGRETQMLIAPHRPIVGRAIRGIGAGNHL